MAEVEKRYVIIHGHFYQPPRESPWTGLVTAEPGAAPFHNWNERILSECYAANARARTTDATVVRINNNYEALNFDCGPTLMSWLNRHGQSAYRNILRADALSAGEYAGHGNAIAQAYNHSILPLLDDRGRRVQVAWGTEDFLFRFGRKPEGLWLPECAADDSTLRAVLESGIAFTILGSQQGEFKTRPGDIDDGGAGPFTWRFNDAALAIFRYDHELSNLIFFGDPLTDGARLADVIAQRALRLNPGGALLIANDGEVYGHHRRTGAAELARAIEILKRRDDIEITNCSRYLASHPASGGFTIREPSSWSCPHGIERWRSECGCRINPGARQHWRAPMREAMEFVMANADRIYDRFAGQFTADAEAALRESIRLAIDADPVAADEFFDRHKVIGEYNRTRLVRLFEMERAAHCALTSCGWFFDDFGGPEGRVLLRWAARAVEVASEFAPGIERELVERLRRISSNRREIGDAAALYVSLKIRESRGRI